MLKVLLLVFSILLMQSGKVYAEKIVLAAAAGSIPTSYIENGEQTGILVDVINQVFMRAGYTVEIKLMPWARCLRSVEEGTVDGIFSVYMTAERQTFLSYTSEALITQVQAFFVPIDSPIVFDGDFQQLAEKSIGIINGTSYGPKVDAAIEQGLFKAVDEAQNSKSNVRKLLAGRVDLIPSYRHVVFSTAKTLGAAHHIKQLSPPIEAIPSYLAFTNKRDFSIVIGEYDKALSEMKSDGTYDRIFEKYFQ
ncbi:substrate-binding periplasmic protein [Agarivorans aestuarii]|uniref:substrate-binding periplasmic protein n=1 Tax=Agarivorans aestuarii TaxID=1563703 RepID=UPI001C817A54|nr:transporter substrate-binding domain-containing protein [Agarivorans aestuarii]